MQIKIILRNHFLTYEIDQKKKKKERKRKYSVVETGLSKLSLMLMLKVQIGINLEGYLSIFNKIIYSPAFYHSRNLP